MIHRTPSGGAADRSPRPRPRRGAVLFLLLLALPAPAAGHGTPIPLVSWGDFPPAIARCQRVIGRAAAACGLRVWRARRACALTALSGGTCDESAADADAEAARIAALDDVSRHCTAMQVANLQFLDVREAQTDVIRFCREAEAAATSLLLAPIEKPITPDTPACVEAAAAAGTKLLGAAFRSRQRLLDRIAISAIAGREKNAMLARSTADISATNARIAAALHDRCPPAAFDEVYGSDAGAVLELLASRGDCLAGDAYAQGGVLCPAPACGNRMREGGEECDDGNTAGGDGCTADCRREAVTSDSRS